MTRFIAVISGKGGAGKTTSTINIGHALHTQGMDVVVLDANLMTPNLALHLGEMNPTGTVNAFIHKQKELTGVVHLHESGLKFIPASPSYTEYRSTNTQKLHEIFEHLDNTADFVLVDAPSGLGPDVREVLKQSDEALIVINPTLSSVIDGLKSIELANTHDNIIAGVILNMSNKGRHELTQQEVETIIGHPLIATIRTDSKIRKALHRQAPLHHLYPRSRSAGEFRKIAEHLCFRGVP